MLVALRKVSWKLAVCAACLAVPAPGLGQETDSALSEKSAGAADENIAAISAAVIPILREHCWECHGADIEEGGLRLDALEYLLDGGDSSKPAIVPGRSDRGTLLERITSDDPERRMPHLDDPLPESKIELIRQWIAQGASWPEDVESDSGSATTHWSFLPVARPTPPPSEDSWAAEPIDAFVWDRLDQAGLQPNDPANRVDLIRRIYLDMLGLPPTPAEVGAFVADTSEDATVRLIERVLASPHYGERWARHWLDVVRFAESDGFETNHVRANAWPYRDYVIDAFNSDKPFDQFIREQLAGDALGADAATGFLVAGARDIVTSPDIQLTLMQRQDELADIVQTTATTFLGLTAGCARCHNHKFDPIPQTEYYALQAVFAGVRRGERPLPSDATAETASPAPDPAAEGGESAPAQVVYAGTFEQPAPTHRLYRGEPNAPREQVAPGGISAVGLITLDPDSPEQQRRLALADWIASPANPLTARVLVNRIWHYHFGVGLVATPSDFGANGESPSHPELLDWLADEFVRSGWSIKHVQRLILNSNTYQQSSRPRAEALQIDAQARLLWRFPPRRMEAEAIRDSILAVSGELNPEAGGPGFLLFDIQKETVWHYFPVEVFEPNQLRRMVYMTKPRQEQDDVFGALDCPDGNQTMPRRTQSTTPLQALNLLNSPFVMQQAAAFSDRLLRDCGESPTGRLEHAFRLCYGRRPTADEQTDALALAQSHGWPALCRALFNANEFVFLP